MIDTNKMMKEFNELDQVIIDQDKEIAALRKAMKKIIRPK